MLGTDGGIYQSFDRADGWQHVRNVPAGEYYRVNVDMGSPYRICGGLQDNESWITPSAVWSKDGITNGAGFNISGGDGAYCAFDAENPNLVYAESQNGTLFRIDLTNGFTKDLQPAPAEGRNSFRYHWVSPFVAERARQGRHLPRRQPRLQAHRARRQVAGDQPRPVEQGLREDDGDRERRRGLRRHLRAHRIAGEGRAALGRHRRRQALEDRGRRRPAGRSSPRRSRRR